MVCLLNRRAYVQAETSNRRPYKRHWGRQNRAKGGSCVIRHGSKNVGPNTADKYIDFRHAGATMNVKNRSRIEISDLYRIGEYPGKREFCPVEIETTCGPRAVALGKRSR